MSRLALTLALLATSAAAQEPLYSLHVTMQGVTTISEPVERQRCFDVAHKLMVHGAAFPMPGGGVMIVPVIARCIVAGEPT